MTSRLRTALALLLLLALAAPVTGCFDEELAQEDLDGVIVLPGDAVADARELGVVYIGIYEGFDPEQLGYPYPATGPRVGDNPIGDALPYGGTSIGDFTYGCYRTTLCEIVSGRYGTLEDVLEVNPVDNQDGEAVTSEEMFDECSWYYGWNSLTEFSFIGVDRLDFSQNAEGDWEAPFRAWHSRLPEGALLWGFVDNDHTSCTVDSGTVNRRRPEDGVFFREGSNFPDVLNFPDKYITAGDLLSSQPTVVQDGQRDGYRLTLDYIVEDR